MTESGLGALVVTDLKTLKSRRLLAAHPSIKAEKGLVIKAAGHSMIDLRGKPARFNVDGTVLSTDNTYLYYCPLTGHTLYRIKPPPCATRPSATSSWLCRLKLWAKFPSPTASRLTQPTTSTLISSKIVPLRAVLPPAKSKSWCRTTTCNSPIPTALPSMARCISPPPPSTKPPAGIKVLARPAPSSAFSK